MAHILLGISIVTSSAFFFCWWVTNAPSFGAHNMGYALGFDFISISLIYCSFCVVILSCCAALVSVFRHRPALRYLVATPFALLPLCYLFLLDVTAGRGVRF